MWESHFHYIASTAQQDDRTNVLANPIRGTVDIAKWHISAPTPWEKTIYDPFQDADIGSQFPLQKSRDNYIRGSCGLLSYIHAPDIYLFLEIPLAKSKTRLCNFPPSPPTGTEQSVLTRAYTLHLPLGSLPPEICKCSKAGTSGLKWWPTRSMTWTTTWQSSADCRSGQLPVIYDSKPSSSPIKIKDSAFPQQSDSTGPSAR
ncbi:hypothetical protein M431DRAFT_485198 [Trichoderma harzianum CBS 226.95]|uniref:Uncharacterized protein n=1 Tax=Trichoderma harzianum CBS 226.95 TaxID=983964 RepID=A0A2T4A2Q8_TRIHA|nr:hypothetical protein M431DRAFT_485198 [Trichoderma harzianum CBS 226.95]PTB51351.1 hypothetical protein M431DRAFT_485198 [Trichoderma harzianum CBS 226.95]